MTRVGLTVAAALVVWAVSAGPAGASPLFTGAQALPDGTVLYPDASDRHLYYFVPLRLSVARRDGQLQFFFYKSEAVRSSNFDTGDARASRGGVLAFTLAFLSPDDAQLARWRAVKGDGARFRALPAARAFCQLLLKRPGTDRSAPPEGEPSAEALAQREAPWDSRTFRFALTGPTATLLWEELARPDNLALVADIQLATAGYELVEEPGESPRYEAAERMHRFSVTLPVSRKEQPDLFRVISLNEKIAFRMRSLKVYCLDFAGEALAGLERVRVEIRVTSARGQTSAMSISFGPSTEPSHDLEFNVLEPRDGVYRYRVRRYFADGRVDDSGWQDANSVVLDVTRYEAEDDRAHIP